MRRILILCLSLSIFSAKYSVAQSYKVEAYIQKYKTLAISEMVRTGVPAAISMAQGIVESQAGASWLSVHANNQFGIKCKTGWRGQTVYHHDDRRNECFRKYNSAKDSWRDHSDFLKNSKRYDFLFYLNPLDYEVWAHGLKQAGYATNSRYAEQLINAIENYHLNQYSQQGLALSKEDNIITTPPEKETYPSEKKRATNIYPSDVFRINRRSVLYLPTGTQLIGIAEKYRLPLRRLLRYNELKTDVLPHGMLIFLQKKRRKGSHKTHVVQAGETFHEIAQKEGIRLKLLLKRNYLTGEILPRPGEILVLKGHAKKPRQAKSQKRNSSHSKRNSIFVYKIKYGDTLYDISRKFNVSIAEIKRINHIKGSLIRTGETLRIPQNK